MHEKRKLLRKKAPERIEIYDRTTEGCLGQVVNMTTSGLLLLSDRPVPINTVFQLRLLIPETIEGMDAVDFGAESLWESPAQDENKHWTGLQIIDLSAQNTRIIDILIRDWGSCD